MAEKLENKLKWEWQEFIPVIGWAKCLAINFDNAPKRNYKGLGGQFKKHCEQVRENGLTLSIPISILSYTVFWQGPSTSLILYYLIK